MAERGRNKKRGPLSKEAKARQKQRRKEEIQQLKNIGVGALETFTPLGDVQTAKDASKAFQEGRYFDAAGNAALIAAGYTPLGPLVRPAGRLAKRVVRDKDMLLPALTDKDYAGLVARETIMGKGPLAGKSVGAADARTRLDYPDTGGYHPSELFMMKHRGIDPAKKEVIYHSTPSMEAAQEIAEGNYKGSDGRVWNTKDPLASMTSYPRATKDSDITGGTVAFVVNKGDIDKHKVPVDISGSKHSRADGRHQFNPTEKELDDMINASGVDPFVIKTDSIKSHFINNPNLMLEKIKEDDYYSQFLKGKKK